MRTRIVLLLAICSVLSSAAFSIPTQHLQQDFDIDLQKTEMSIGDTSQQVAKLNKSIADEQQQLAELKISQQKAAAKLAEENAALNQQLRAAFRLGQSESFKVALNQNDPNTIQRYLTYYRFLNEARLQLINKTQQTLTSLNTIMDSIGKSQQNLKLLLTQKKSQQAKQDSAQTHRDEILNKTDHAQPSVVVNQKALQDIISQLKKETQKNIATLPFKQTQGKLTWPIKGPIIAHFGSARDADSSEHLSGVVIKAAFGTPIRSIYSGKVIFANWLRGFGLLIIIDHGNNYMSLYGRDRALYAKVGDHVNKGDIIATAGNSGGFNKSSLYFEIRQNGIPINPNSWCR